MRQSLASLSLGGTQKAIEFGAFLKMSCSSQIMNAEGRSIELVQTSNPLRDHALHDDKRLENVLESSLADDRDSGIKSDVSFKPS